MTTRAPLPLVALLACALAATVPAPASAAVPHVDAAKAAGLRNRRKLRAVLRHKGLAKLPSVAGALAGHTRGHHHGLAADVVGTPPTLVSIPSASVKDLFWQPGVIDAIAAGTPTPAQCNQFWAGQTDGESGGMGACRMAENVGYSFGDLLSGDTSLCYMKRFPTRPNLASGALTLLSGGFPGDDPTRLFSVPAGSGSRIVQVSVSGEKEGAQDVFLRVHSEDENQAAGDLYAVDLWFCRGAATAKGFDHIRITNDGELISEEQQAESDGANVSTVTGFVTFTSGAVVYDTTRSRRAVNSHVDPNGGWKSDDEIRSDDTIAMRSYGAWQGGTNLQFVVSSFSGSGLDSLRFLAGAFKERDIPPPGSGMQWPDVIGSTEFRTSFYAASPGDALESQLAGVDFDTDPFYAAPPATNVDASAFACDVTPDVHLALDFANPAGAAVKAQCEQRLYDGSQQFCDGDPAVRAAEMNLPTACYGPH